MGRWNWSQCGTNCPLFPAFIRDSRSQTDESWFCAGLEGIARGGSETWAARRCNWFPSPQQQQPSLINFSSPSLLLPHTNSNSAYSSMSMSAQTVMHAQSRSFSGQQRPGSRSGVWVCWWSAAAVAINHPPEQFLHTCTPDFSAYPLVAYYMPSLTPSQLRSCCCCLCSDLCPTLSVL